MRPAISDVEIAVCARFGLSREQMQSPNRARIVSRPRQIAMFLAREMTGLSLPRIGRHFGRDHTTILYAARKIARLVAQDGALAAEVQGCRALLARTAAREAA
jgi:chromosomal replication initiator protein